MLKQVTAEEMVKLAHGVQWDKVVEIAKTQHATHIVYFQNNDFTSSHFGDGTFMMVGPTCTYKSPTECDGKHLHDLPSRRQYAECYCEVPNEA